MCRSRPDGHGRARSPEEDVHGEAIRCGQASRFATTLKRKALQEIRVDVVLPAGSRSIGAPRDRMTTATVKGDTQWPIPAETDVTTDLKNGRWDFG